MASRSLVPVTALVPLTVKRALVREARKEGMSLSTYVKRLLFRHAILLESRSDRKEPDHDAAL